MSDRRVTATAEDGLVIEGGESAARRRIPAWFAAGGLLGALAASSCCVVPLVLVSLGIGGAWIANLTQLAPYKPYFVAATLVCLGAGYWFTRRASQVACAEGMACACPRPNRIVTIALAAATVLVITAFAFDYVAYLL